MGCRPVMAAAIDRENDPGFLGVGPHCKSIAHRSRARPQRMSVVHRSRIKHPALVQTVALIEGHSDDKR